MVKDNDPKCWCGVTEADPIHSPQRFTYWHSFKPQPAPRESTDPMGGLYKGLTAEQLVKFRKAYFGFEAKPGLPLSEEVKDIRVLLDAHAAALDEIIALREMLEEVTKKRFEMGSAYMIAADACNRNIEEIIRLREELAALKTKNEIHSDK